MTLIEASEPEMSFGTGVKGRLGLINGTCMGIVKEGHGRTLDKDGSVIVWPPGTTISQDGSAIRITSQGRTVQVGDIIEGGSRIQRKFPTLAKLLPAKCRNNSLRTVGLSS